jgi:hypothetical protein
MSEKVLPERVAAIAAAARIPLSPDAPARIARTVGSPVGRIAAADIALDMEVEPATFVAVQRKDAGL